ncbi:hypothetical protein Tco_1218359 [Tanacetum coccineum]
MRQRRWVELLSDYDCVHRYPRGKHSCCCMLIEARKVLSRTIKEFRALVMTIGLTSSQKIIEAQTAEALKPTNLSAEDVGIRGMLRKESSKGKVWKPRAKELCLINLGTRFGYVYGYHLEDRRPSERMISTLEDMFAAPALIDFKEGVGIDIYLSRVHNTFHVLNLKKFLSDESLVIPLDGLRIDDKLHFVEEPVEIMDRETKQLKEIVVYPYEG